MAADDPSMARALRVLAAHPVIDGHNDLPWAIRENEKAPRDVAAYDIRGRAPGATDLARLKAGHVGGQFWSVYTPGESKYEDYARLQLEQIDIARQVIARYPELAWGPDRGRHGARAAHGRVGSALGLEGGHAIQNSLGALRAYYALGVRYMTLTHNVTLDWADCAAGPATHGGLTKFGEEVVREMNRLGMLVDLSHVSPETMDDALRVAEAPGDLLALVREGAGPGAAQRARRHPEAAGPQRRRGHGHVRRGVHLQGLGGRERGARQGDRRPHQGRADKAEKDASRASTRRRIRCPRSPWPRSRTTSSTCARRRAPTTWAWAGTTTATATGRRAWRT
jgi:membrane dipeptidase